MVRCDTDISPSVDDRLQQLGYKVSDWSAARSALPESIKTVFSKASKKQNGECGIPDRIYINSDKKLLILVEEKSHIKEHELEDTLKGAISGCKWYLSRFLNANLPNRLTGFFNNWKILGIAVSGNLQQEYKHRFSCFYIDYEKDTINSLPQITNFMTEGQFLTVFNTLDEEKAVVSVSIASKKINNLLRSIDSQKRPVLLSALMICLHRGKFNNDFADHYKTYSPDTLVNNILLTANKILTNEGMPLEKLKVLESELAFLKTDTILNSNDILKQILEELESSVIPLFNSEFATTSNYDIIGKFYEEFLKYAGVSNVKKGIVLTPRHITTLFTELIDLKENDKVLDLCCGTGAFLIAGMNAIINKINNSERSDKQEAVVKVKEKQLLGFEQNATMYICAISNMLFRGDGKSSIYNYDSIHDKRAQKILEDFKATVGFINPPYSGKENKEDPTPKEISFLIKLLDNCSRYGVIIAPLSMYFKDEKIRDNILKKHTLKAVINMPSDLFQPNASTHTAIAVFETNRSFNYAEDEVLFIDLPEDGFVLSKNRGRTDVYGRWAEIKQDLLSKYKHPDKYLDNKTVIKRKIAKSFEWSIYAYATPDYNVLNEEESFVTSIKEYLIFKARESQNLIGKDIDEITMMEILTSYYGVISSESAEDKKMYLNIDNWKEFKLTNIFNYQRGTRLVVAERIPGEVPLITAGFKNQGVAEFINENDKMALCSNCITIDMFGNVFYKDSEFFCDDNIIAISPKKTILNKYSALFLLNIFKRITCHFDYGRQYRLKHFQSQSIKLPADKNGEPDWVFMEKYIKTISYSCNL